jgi:hypothetical protein
MKKLIIFISIFFNCSLLLFSQTNIPAGNVSGVWGVDSSPYLIQGNISIPNDSILYIEPGTEIRFTGHYELNVQGRIIADGKSNKIITFTSSDTTGFTNHYIKDGSWRGIRFNETNLTNDTSKIQYCTIEYCKAIGNEREDDLGGAIFAKDFDKIIIENCKISNNYATAGAGIFVRSSIINSSQISLKIINNEITNNFAKGGGGGIVVQNTPVEIINNKIAHNYGGHDGGGMCFLSSPNAVFSSNLVYNNSSIQGGGVYYSGKVKSINNTIVLNESNLGGGVAVYGTADFINDIIYGNEGRENEVDQVYMQHAQVTFSYCLLGEGILAELCENPTYNNCVYDDPLFIDDTVPLFFLQSNSPCINKGIIDTAGLGLSHFDLANNPRIVHGRIDIGAYEYQDILVDDTLENIKSSIYPNPTLDGKVIINMDNIVMIRIVDLYGKVLFKIENNNEIDLSMYSTGVYLIVIQTDKGFKIEKILKY